MKILKNCSCQNDFPSEWLKYYHVDNREWEYKSLFMSICVSRMHNNHDNNDNDMQCTFHSLSPFCVYNFEFNIAIQYVLGAMKIYSSNIKGCRRKLCENWIFYLNYFSHPSLDYFVCWNVETWNSTSCTMAAATTSNNDTLFMLNFMQNLVCEQMLCVCSPLSHSTKQSITWRE